MLSMIPMHARTFAAAMAAFAALASLGSIAGAADRTPENVRVEAAIDVGWAYMSTHGTITEPSAATGVGPTAAPAPSGDGTFDDSGFAIGGRVNVLAPWYGYGVPRAILLGGVTGFFGRDKSGNVASFHPGGAADSGVGLNRKLVFDLAVGVVFPMCREWTCMDLRAFFGAAFALQTVSASSNETTDGGAMAQSSSSTLRTGPLLGVIVTKPICSDCSEKSLRLELGTIARSILFSNLDFASATARSYSASVSGLELEVLAGLLLPL